EKIGGAIEPGHHRLERILLVQEPVFVRSDDAIGGKSKVGGHGINQGRDKPGRQVWVERARARSVVLSTESSASPPRSTEMRWETYHRADAAGHNGASLTASFNVQTT